MDNSNDETANAFMACMIAECTVCGFRAKLPVTTLHCIAAHARSAIFFDFPTREEELAELDAMQD